MKTELEQKAEHFAINAHRGQVRKYTGEDYITHPKAVADLVRGVGGTEHMIAAAWLHDTVEDCDKTLEEIESRFGPLVRVYVYWLTDKSKPEDGNRFTRKAIDRHHIKQAPHEAKTIKLADLIHNTISIVKHDANFAKVYLQEKRHILWNLMEGNHELFIRAARQVYTGLKLTGAYEDEYHTRKTTQEV